MDSGADRSSARPARAAHRARSRAVLAAGALAALLAVGGCGAASDGGGTADRSLASSEDAEAGGRADRAGGQYAPGADAAKQARKAPDPGASAVTHVIRTAELAVEVRDVPKAVAAARVAAQDGGGLVASESTERLDDAYETSRLVLRVPQDRYEEVLRTLAGSGKLLSRTSDAKDVTDRVVDTESRIATQRASVARVRELMDRADELADVVTLEGELSSRQAALESLLAQRANLKDRTSLATITLELTERDAPEPAGDAGPGFVDALGGGWDAFVTTLRWIAVAVGAAAPFLVTAVAALVGWRAARARRERRGAAAEQRATGPAAP
ncbi:DUF4349 domain-containing protein [Streptomyces sp. NPDC088729]|uniref:DUF4349 domain-containing protein n=1 Tax=Streptomyces sp. NPDC088729 TaxID=3365876 RepID=UPI0037FF862A